MSYPDYDNDLVAAVRRNIEAADTAARVDRTGWTRQQWIDDARALMDDGDGSVMCLVNGHVLALLAEIDHPGDDCEIPKCGHRARPGHTTCTAHDHTRVSDTGSWVGDRHHNDDQEDTR